MNFYEKKKNKAEQSTKWVMPFVSVGCMVMDSSSHFVVQMDFDSDAAKLAARLNEIAGQIHNRAIEE